MNTTTDQTHPRQNPEVIERLAVLTDIKAKTDAAFKKALTSLLGVTDPAIAEDISVDALNYQSLLHEGMREVQNIAGDNYIVEFTAKGRATLRQYKGWRVR